VQLSGHEMAAFVNNDLAKGQKRMKAGDWIGLAGLVVSVVGFAIAIWQLVRTAKAAEATQVAVERAENRMALNHLLVLLPQFRLIENDLDAAAQEDDRGLARRSLVAYAHFAAEVAAILEGQSKYDNTLVVDLRGSASQASQAKAALIDTPSGKSTKQITKEVRARLSDLSVHLGTLATSYQNRLE
jgi:hypothetical protein